MEVVSQLKRGLSRQFSTGSLKKSGKFSFKRQASFDPRLSNASRFVYGRQSSLDPNRRSPISDVLAVPENLDSTMQLLFMASQGDVKGVAELLKEGIDVNSVDLDGRTAIHIAACEGHVDVVKLLLSWKANIEARDRWGSTAAVDAKFYGNIEVFTILKARGAKLPKPRKTPMAVSNLKDVPDYEVNPTELQFRRGDDISKNTHHIAKWNGTKVVVKILDKDRFSDPDCINAFKLELSMLLKVRHPNINQFFGAVTQNTPMMIISEYYPKGDLGSYIQRKGRLHLRKVLKFAIDVARGMNYLHECKPDPILHCNLKPKHILLDDGGQLKVAGFGLTKLSKISVERAMLADSMSHKRKLSFYTAPEVYKNETFDRKVDTFSFGLILYEESAGATSEKLNSKPLHEYPKLSFFDIDVIIFDEEITCENGEHIFLVRWKDKPPSEDTWLTYEELQKLDLGLLDDYVDFTLRSRVLVEGENLMQYKRLHVSVW